MKYLALAGILLSTQIHAATPTCSPLTEFDRTKCGPLLEAGNANGDWWGYWWRDSPNSWKVYRQAKLKNYPGPSLVELKDAVKSASSFASGVQAAEAAFTKLPLVGSQEEYDLNILHYAACKAMEVNPPPGVVVSKPCTMAVPTPPVPVWVVDSPTNADGTRPAYTYAQGIRSSVSTGRAVSGSGCKPEISQSPSGVTGKVYAAFGPKFDPGWQALCKKP